MLATEESILSDLGRGVGGGGGGHLDRRGVTTEAVNAKIKRGGGGGGGGLQSTFFLGNKKGWWPATNLKHDRGTHLLPKLFFTLHISQESIIYLKCLICRHI